jgi:hypothetical protein
MFGGAFGPPFAFSSPIFLAMLRMLLWHLGVFLWVSLATYLHEPPQLQLSQTTWAAADDRSTHTYIHTTQNNQILGCLESRVLDLQLSLYCLFTWYLNSLHQNSKQQLLLLECGCVGPWESLLSTLDAQVYLLAYTKEQNLVHHNFVKVVGYPPPIPPPPVQTKQNNGCVTILSGLAILHFKKVS